MIRMALAVVALSACAPGRVYVLEPTEPTATTPPGPGYPMHAAVPQWFRPAVLCAIGRKPLAPELHGDHWSCPAELRQ